MYSWFPLRTKQYHQPWLVALRELRDKIAAFTVRPVDPQFFGRMHTLPFSLHNLGDLNSWRDVADELASGLQRAVKHADPTDSTVLEEVISLQKECWYLLTLKQPKSGPDSLFLGSLEDCWNRLQAENPDEEPLAKHQLERYCRGMTPADLENIGRLYGNVCGLVAAAIAAVLAKNLAAHVGGIEKGKEIIHWFWESSKALRALRRSSSPPPESFSDELGSHQDAARLVQRTYEKCFITIPKSPAACYWILWMLNQTAASSHKVTVWAAGYHPKQSTHQTVGIGFLTELKLDSFTLLVDCDNVEGSKSTPQVKSDAPAPTELIEHPEVALTPFGSTLLAALDRAWFVSKDIKADSNVTNEVEEAKRQEEAKRRNVVWSLDIKDPSWDFAELLGGDSIGGAATRGFYFARRKQVPDEGVIVLACVKEVCPGVSGGGHELDQVGGIPEKVRAIARDGRFDTIVVADTTNATQAENTLKTLIEKEGIGTGIRVVNLAAPQKHSAGSAKSQ